MQPELDNRSDFIKVGSKHHTSILEKFVAVICY
jgi:hypothetical protein